VSNVEENLVALIVSLQSNLQRFLRKVKFSLPSIFISESKTGT